MVIVRGTEVGWSLRFSRQRGVGGSLVIIKQFITNIHDDSTNL